MSQLKFKYLFLLLIISLWINVCLSMNKEEGDIDEQLEHAHSFLESFMAGTADSIFMDTKIFSRFRGKSKPDTKADDAKNATSDIIDKDSEERVDYENKNIHEAYSKSTTESNVTKSKPIFKYHQVFRENYNNIQQKVEKQDDEISIKVNLELVFNGTTNDKETKHEISNLNNPKQDISTTENYVKDVPFIVYAAVHNDKANNDYKQDDNNNLNDDFKQDIGTTTTNDESKQDTGTKGSNELIQDTNVNNYFQQDIFTFLTNDESKQDIGTNANNAFKQDTSTITTKNEPIQENGKNDKSVEEKGGKEYSDINNNNEYGPIDRSINDDYVHDINAKDFFQGGQPFPLRDKDYFNSYFEISPSYDLRSSSFLSEPSETGLGDKTVKRVVYNENRKKQKTKHIFSGVIGGLAGTFIALAGKKLLFTFVGITFLLLMGITGSVAPSNLFQNLFPDVSTDFSYEATYDGNGNPTGSTVGVDVAKSGRSSDDNRFEDLIKPVSKLYNHFEKSTISAMEPVVNTLEQVMGMLTYLSKAIDVENLDKSVREGRDGLWSMIPSFQFPTEGMVAARKYVQDGINEFVDVMAMLGSDEEFSEEEIKKLLKTEANIDMIDSSKILTMINSESDRLIDYAEQPVSNELEQIDSKYSNRLINVHDEEMNTEEQSDSNALKQNDSKYISMISKEIDLEQSQSKALERMGKKYLNILNNYSDEIINTAEQSDSNIIEQKDHNEFTMISNEIALEEHAEYKTIEQRYPNDLTMISNEIAPEEQDESNTLEQKDHNELTMISNEIALEEHAEYKTIEQRYPNDLTMISFEIALEEQDESNSLEQKDDNKLTMISNEIALEEQPESNSLEQKDHNELKMVSSEIALEEQPEFNTLEQRDPNDFTMIHNEISLKEQPKSNTLKKRDPNELTMVSNGIALEEQPDSNTLEQMDLKYVTITNDEIDVGEQSKFN